MAGLMAVCQVILPPSAGYRGGRSQPDWPALDPRAVPLIGSPDARYVVALLFDYKCPHCQQLHFLLEEAVRLGGGRLAFALCPTPLNTRCNPYLPRDVDEFKDSCELAKVALAVWVAKRGAFPAFDRWMFSFESGDHWQPRSLAAATDQAIALVGRAEFEAARTDPWIDGHLQTSLRIFGGTARSGNTAVPKLVFGPLWVVPEPNDAADLVSIMQGSLALPGR
jgi:hypothetical protein